MARSFVALLGLPVLACGQTDGSDDQVKVPDNMNEDIIDIPMADATGAFTLVGTVYRPNGEGPFPLAIISHPIPRDPQDRWFGDGLWQPREQSRWFVERGFVVAIPMRRGYGLSGGEYSEGIGACEDPHYFEAGRETAKDIVATRELMAKQPYVDGNQVLLVGAGAAGFGSIAAASLRAPGVVGVVAYAPARGAVAPGKICVEDRLVSAMGEYGLTTLAPTLFLHSENDRWNPVPIANRLFKAFRGVSAAAEYVELPPFGTDGSTLFRDPAGIALWGQVTETFVADVGLVQPLD